MPAAPCRPPPFLRNSPKTFCKEDPFYDRYPLL